jgi:flavodoxin
MVGKKCFIFSTSAIQGEKKVANDHAALRKILLSKGYEIAGEFSCKGFNTNAFLKYFGGMNKNSPNEEDLNNAMRFASKLTSKKLSA